MNLRKLYYRIFKTYKVLETRFVSYGEGDRLIRTTSTKPEAERWVLAKEEDQTLSWVWSISVEKKEEGEEMITILTEIELREYFQRISFAKTTEDVFAYEQQIRNSHEALRSELAQEKENTNRLDRLWSDTTVELLRANEKIKQLEQEIKWLGRRLSADACNCTGDQYGWAVNPKCAIHGGFSEPPKEEGK